MILELEDMNNYKLTSKINVTFKRKNKLYKKNIYLLMNKKMKENINLEGNIQYFSDSTYKYIPSQNKGKKLFIILAYNEKLNKILLCQFL